jgi:hypothetical protein
MSFLFSEGYVKKRLAFNVYFVSHNVSRRVKLQIHCFFTVNNWICEKSELSMKQDVSINHVVSSAQGIENKNLLLIRIMT